MLRLHERGRLLLLSGLVPQISAGHYPLEPGAQCRIGVELLALGGKELRSAIVDFQVLLLGGQGRHHGRRVQIDSRFRVFHRLELQQCFGI